MNGGAQFAGSSLLANSSTNGTINFNGSTATIEASSTLKVISQSDINYNGSSNTWGTFVAGKNFSYNGNSTVYMAIEVKG